MDFDFDPFDGDLDWFDAVIIGSGIDAVAADEFEAEQRRRKVEADLFSDLKKVDWTNLKDDAEKG
jgi:hypothetical protein